MKPLVIKTLITSIASIGLLGLFNPNQASAQLIPEPWVAIGSKDSAITYAGGVKVFGFGLEVGTGKDGVMGTDVLKFINLPLYRHTLEWGIIQLSKKFHFPVAYTWKQVNTFLLEQDIILFGDLTDK